MKIKSQRDFWSGLMFVATGIVFAVGATNYSLGTSARPGPGFFPLILSVIMAILGAIVLFKSLTIESEGGDPIGAIAWRPLIVIVASIAVFGAALPRLGMVVTVPILIVVGMSRLWAYEAGSQHRACSSTNKIASAEPILLKWVP